MTKLLYEDYDLPHMSRTFSRAESEVLVYSEAGDIQIPWVELPIELQEAVRATLILGGRNGLLTGARLEKIVCMERDSSEEGHQPEDEVRAFAKLNEEGGFQTYIEVNGYYLRARPSTWPAFGVEAGISVFNYGWIEASVFGKLSLRRPESRDRLVEKSVGLIISNREGLNLRLAFEKPSPGLILSGYSHPSSHDYHYLIAHFGKMDRRAADREMKELGFDPSVIRSVSFDDLVKLQARIAAGVLQRGDLKVICQQVTELLRQIKRGK